MDFRIGLFSALLLLASCGTNKKCCDAANAVVKETTIKDTVVKESKMFLGTIQLHRPFCGGMRPNSEQEKGFIEAVSNADFYLYQGEIPTNQSEFIKFTTNDLGKFTLDLAPGKYNIIQANKLLSLEKFIAVNNPKSEHYKVAPSTCFEKWKNSPDFSFVMTDVSQEKVFTENHRCFTGANPCLKYTGPYPP
ncbi:MAG: hypothetical protein MK066_06685 [Crocinitomicaceae bacterium]|nr:hypothetical protein [Crocinitomicaceae bacterium]